MAPSFLLWQNMRTNPLYPTRNPFLVPSSPFLPKSLTNQNVQVLVDSTLRYNVVEEVDSTRLGNEQEYDFEEFSKIQEYKVRQDYWRSRARGGDGESAVEGRGLIPPLTVSPSFDRIFGGSEINIVPTGYVNLDFGAIFRRVDNPTLPIRQQQNGGFNFDQQIQMAVNGSLGEKMKIGANFDSNNSFDFQNQLKVEYDGFQEDIIKSIEIGNVSMPVQNRLIQGAQNLFGVKTQLQFGKLNVTAVASTQRGRRDELVIDANGQGRTFDIQASKYDENRHFFLAHFFRDNYERWLRGLPQVLSGVNVTRIEVYIMNRASNTETLRNFAAFMDLGEGQTLLNPNNPNIGMGTPGAPAANGSNNLFRNISQNPSFRPFDTGSRAMESSLGIRKGVDFEQINGARKLAPTEFYFNAQLGYLSLFRKLQNDEVLAVSFEYTYNGQVYKVGELTEDYQNRQEDELIFLKLLRPARINPRVPTWDLMMKNVYNLNANQLLREGFQLQVIYRDDRTGLDNPSLLEGKNVKDKPLIRLTGLDNLNPQNDPAPDGNFDFVEGLTMLSDRGLLIFPVLEPFGSNLEKYFEPEEIVLKDKYVFDTLYRTTQADAQLVTRLDKYFIKGRLTAGSASEIQLPGLNISPGSVIVSAGNIPLTEGVDYTIDYNVGRVVIINDAILQSGKKIAISFEKADLVSFQTRSLLGTRLEYLFNDKFNLGGTFLYLNERPNVTRIATGNETLRNSLWGLDANFNDESRWLTKLADALPFTDTKEQSLVQFSGEFAHLIPGTSNKVDGDQASYIDDFEAAVTPFNLGGAANQNWKLSSTPETPDDRFDLSNQTEDMLGATYRRARLAWYNIDNIFYRESGPGVPTNITREDRRNHYVRRVVPQEIFPQQDRTVIITPEPLFEMAYFPSERGMYNYNTNLNFDGLLPEPKKNFGGITRAITTEVDFDRTNIEYIEFWLLDPFIEGENGRVLDGVFNQNNTTGGKLFFNLGDISEDVMADGRHAFENGLPADGDPSETSSNEWGRITREQYLLPAFDNSESSRENQDVGLDGLKNENEADFFRSRFLDRISVSQDARNQINQDVSGDLFQYYLDEQFDQNDTKILERYKKFNGMEGNTPVSANQNLPYTPSGSNSPDNEDLNTDNTINELENYYEYELDLRPSKMVVGQNYIVDKVTHNEAGENVDWYLFRIPVRQPDRVQGDISGFKSIRWMRTYLTEFEQPVVLRMANFRMVGSQWRVFQESLFEKGLFEIPEPDNSNITVDVVGIEQNSQGSATQSPYVLPPGINRDRDNTSTVERRLNEQSLRICVEDLAPHDARAVFKNLNQDLVQFERIKMFLHADSEDALDGEITAFLRMGTDYTDNYYEIEVPLLITPKGTRDPRQIWPLENEIDIAIQDIVGVKVERDNNQVPLNLPFSQQIGQYKVTVVGRPELSLTQGMMIGVRNPGDTGGSSRSICVWANELRVTGFTKSNGWAANALMNAKIADVAVVSASIRHSSIGFGGLETRLSQRSRTATTQYDISTNVDVHKLLPSELGVSIPMYFSVANSTSKPKFDPLNPDVPLELALGKFETNAERNAYKKIALDQMNSKNISFTNVRKIKSDPEAKSHFYDLSNFSFSYAYGIVKQNNADIQDYNFKTNKGNITYSYSPKALTIEPFKNSEWLSSPHLRLIKDFNLNLAPSQVLARIDVDRRFLRSQYRNDQLSSDGVDPLFQKSFFINRFYSLNWDLTNNLRADYSARVMAVVDEPEGDLDSEAKQDSVKSNFWRFGRKTNFNQTFNLNYTIPFDKSPITDWIRADYKYGATYTWQTGAIGQKDTLGNVIQNTRNQNITGKIDLVRLYNKSKKLEALNAPKRPNIPGRDNVEAEDTIGTPFSNKLLKLLMMVKEVSFTYDKVEGSFLPGYLPNTGLLGMDRALENPGLGFLFGSQDPMIRYRLAAAGAMAPSSELTMPFSQNKATNLRLGSIVEPFQDFRITLTATKREVGDYQEIFRNSMDSPGDFVSISPKRVGGYSITTIMLGTSFSKDDSENNSPLFTDFEQNRAIIKSRLDSENSAAGEYSINGQDVLIPSFLAAYRGQDASEVKLNPFPKTPLPNWRIEYRGLSRLKGLSDIFSSINILHEYSSTYDASNFSNSLQYQQGLELYNTLQSIPTSDITNDEGLFIPIYVLNQVVLSERFSPLIGLDLLTKDRLNVAISYNKERNLGLNFSNSQITEQKSNDVGLEIGYTKAGVKVPFKIQGRQTVLKNDLTFRLNTKIVDTRQVQRKIEEGSTITNGNLNIQIRPTIGYLVNQNLSVTLYFDRTINDPRVTTSYRRSSTSFGGQLRFNLSQ
ncbi:T9SS outer membrane translocon Sov/SprA [Algoriphagus machipongonensis]|uniref:Gliding motility-related protein n=1 Tax=Algoriphagus machipongonensis TaxID=388413 RepID=E2RUF0_9BACT|nr:cell surface protein SprA [Algoriphagus machipongonensis]EFQ79254.1 gliding motility-related protein [Algoriphagus machipongonensis]